MGAMSNNEGTIFDTPTSSDYQRDTRDDAPAPVGPAVTLADLGLAPPKPVDGAPPPKPIDRDRAQRIIQQSLGGVTMSGVNRSKYALLIAKALPAEALDETLLSSMDVRQFAQAITKYARDHGGAINDVELSDEELKEISMGTASITLEIRKQLNQQLGDATPLEGTVTPEARQRYIDGIPSEVLERSRSYLDPGPLTAPPVDVTGGLRQDPETGELVAEPGSTGLAPSDFIGGLDSLGTDQGVTVQQFMTGTQLRDLMRQNVDAGAEMDRAIFEERTMLDEGGKIEGDRLEIRLNNEAGTAPRGMPQPGASGRDAEREYKNTYTLTEMQRYPSEQMSPAEVIAMSKRLEAAGFYQNGGKPTSAGDATDVNFKAAWKQLMVKALESGQSMTDVLDENEASYKDALQEQFSTQLTDPARVRMNADAIGRSTLGRKMTDEEHGKMIEFVHNLERRNAMVGAGLDPDVDLPGVEQLDEGIIADIDAQMNEFTRAQNPDEAGGKDVADQYSVFSSMLAGPGRGVG